MLKLGHFAKLDKDSPEKVILAAGAKSVWGGGASKEPIVVTATFQSINYFATSLDDQEHCLREAKVEMQFFSLKG